MKKTIKYFIFFISVVLLSTIVSADVNRVVSSTNVAPSGTFTVRYNLASGVAPYYYIIRDTINGGCTFAGTVDPLVLPTTFNSPATETVDFTINAPSTAGTCTLSGFYKLGDDPNVNFDQLDITIGSGNGGGSSNSFNYTYLIIGAAVVVLFFIIKKK